MFMRRGHDGTLADVVGECLLRCYVQLFLFPIWDGLGFFSVCVLD